MFRPTEAEVVLPPLGSRHGNEFRPGENFCPAVLCSVRRKRKLFYHHWAAHSFPTVYSNFFACMFKFPVIEAETMCRLKLETFLEIEFTL